MCLSNPDTHPESLLCFLGWLSPLHSSRLEVLSDGNHSHTKNQTKAVSSRKTGFLWPKEYVRTRKECVPLCPDVLPLDDSDRKKPC